MSEAVTPVEDGEDGAARKVGSRRAFGGSSILASRLGLRSLAGSGSQVMKDHEKRKEKNFASEAEEIEAAKLNLEHVLFIFVNLIQVVAIVSSGKLVEVPSQWDSVFFWLTDFFLLDVTTFFDANVEVFLILKIATTVLIPVYFYFVIQLLEPEKNITYEESLKGSLRLRQGLVVITLAGSIACLVANFLIEGFLLQLILIYVCCILFVYPFYYLLKTFVLWVMFRRASRTGKTHVEIKQAKKETETHFLLFLFVTVYSAVVRSCFSLFGVSNQTIGIIGLAATGGAAISMILYVIYYSRQAFKYEEKFAEWLVKLFRDRFWYFQAILMMDKTILLGLQIIDDTIIATSITLAYMLVFTILIVLVKPYTEDERNKYKAWKVEGWGRTMNIILLGVIFAHSLVEGSVEKEALGYTAIAVSGLTALGFFWLVLDSKLLRIIRYEFREFLYESKWSGKDEAAVKKTLRASKNVIPFEEYLVATDSQKAWIYTHGTDDQLSAIDVESFNATCNFSKATGKSVIGLIASRPDAYTGEKLQLQYKQLDDEDLQRLEEIFKINETITSLQLKSTGIDDEAVKKLLPIFLHKDVVANISFEQNSLGEPAIEEVAHYIKQTSALREINLGGVGIDDQGFGQIILALKVNKSLNRLDVHKNSITDEVLPAMEELLSVNETLLTLRIDKNKMRRKSRKRLTELWSQRAEALNLKDAKLIIS